MIPIRDHQKTKTFPIVTYLLIATNVVVFFLMFSMGQAELEQFIRQYALIPRELLRSGNWAPLFTSMFLHGSIGHIFGNMLFLNVFGDNMEDRFGHLGYLVFYLLAGLGASALQIFVDPSSTIPNLGASGAIAGLLGGYLVLFPKHRIDIVIPIGFVFHRATVPAYTMLIYWIIAQLFGGLGSLGVEGGGIAYFAHIGGFVAGLLLTVFAKPLFSDK